MIFALYTKKTLLIIHCRIYKICHDEFISNKAKLQSVVNSHFDQIRSQIDQHRVKLKERIDDIALSMLGETKNFEDIQG